MQSPRFSFHARAFTLLEMLIVITIIGILASLTMGAYTYSMRAAKRRNTTVTFEAVKNALDRYFSDFGEYPEPAGSAQMVAFVGKPYDTSGAACLYQALTGDGYDQIKGVSSSTGSSSASAASDGKTEGIDEIKSKMLVEVPQTIFTKKGSVYVLIDGFGRPFQYIKAALPSSTSSSSSSSSSAAAATTTVNSSYDLWSYSEDEINTTKKSIDTLKDPSVSVKWIKNW